ncbi:MAG TPA: methyltransferase domain-containing protein [Thermoleophilaceae bacterium]|nr:methyltransferase domain-containing protein [Thermoleophilaceae bacterium]
MTDVPGAETFRVAADAYDRHIGRYGPALAAQLVAAAGLRPGQSALDVGCGPGALSAALAERLGADNVAAVDPSEPFARACAERVPGAQVELGAAEALPFGDGTFDGALSQLVVNFMSDAPAGVAEMRRVTRSGGAVVSAVWDYAEGMTLLRRFWDAAVALDPAAASLDEGVSMPYCRPHELERLWRSAGLEDVETSQLVVEAGYSGFDDLWQPLERGVGPSGAYAAGLPAEARTRLREELRRRLGAGEAPFRLPARAWCVVGRVP